jgi:hypothetical protein
VLEHYNVSNLTEGIDLEQSKLRDRVEERLSHLEVFEIENEAKDVRQGVPSVEEDLGQPPCSP